MLNGILAILTGLAGTSVLFMCWRKRYHLHRIATLCGWVLLLVSLGFWKAYSGLEFGIVFGLMMPALYAWIFTLMSSELKPPGRTRVQSYRILWPTLARVVRNGAWFFLVIPALALSSILITTAFTYLLPIQEINRLATAVLLMPAVWGAAVTWLLIDNRMMRPVLANSVLGLCSACYLFL